MTTQLNRWLRHISLEGGNPYNVITALSGYLRFGHYTCPLVLGVLQKERSLYIIYIFWCDNFRCLMWFCFKYSPYLSPDSAFVVKDCNLVTSISLSAAGVFSFPLQVHQTHPFKGQRTLRFECMHLCVGVSRQSSHWLQREYSHAVHSPNLPPSWPLFAIRTTTIIKQTSAKVFSPNLARVSLHRSPLSQPLVCSLSKNRTLLTS